MTHVCATVTLTELRICNIHEVLLRMESISYNDPHTECRHSAGTGSIVSGFLLWKHKFKGAGGGGGSVFHSYSCATYILWFLEYTGRVKPSIFHVWVMHRLLPPSAHKSPAFRQGSFKSWRWGSVPRGSTSCLRGRRQTPPVSAKDQLRRLWNVRGSLMAKELC